MRLPPGEDDGTYAEEVLAPFGSRFPGLAPPGHGPAETDGVEEALAQFPAAGRLVLVPVERPADVVGSIGWQGAVNYDRDPGELSAVLRSWEDRYGLRLVGLGVDTLHAAVARPAASADLGAVAAEQYAFCPDVVTQGTGTIGELARESEGTSAWYCWWD